MTLFATFALLDDDQSYKARTRAIVNHRLARPVRRHGASRSPDDPLRAGLLRRDRPHGLGPAALRRRVRGVAGRRATSRSTRCSASPRSRRRAAARRRLRRSGVVGAGLARQPRRRLLPAVGASLRAVFDTTSPNGRRRTRRAPASTLTTTAATTATHRTVPIGPALLQEQHDHERDPREPHAADQHRAHARRRPRRWPRSRPTKAGGMVPDRRRPRCPALDAKVDEYVESIVDARRALARVRRQGGRRARRWATTTSAPRPTRRTGCWRRRSGRCSRARSARAARSRPRCSTCAAPSRTSTRSRRRGVKKLLGHDPVRRQDRRLLPQVRERAEAPRRDHQGALRRPGRAAQGQRRARAGEGAPLGDDAAARRSTSTSPSSSTPTLDAKIAAGRGAPIPRRRRRCATTCCSTCARSTRTC